MRAGFFVALLCACASNQKLPPGNELEASETQTDTQASTVGDSRMPTSNAELARAFEPPPEPAPPPRQIAAPAAPAAPDATAAERENFAARCDEAKKLIAAQTWDQVDPMLDALEAEGERIGPQELQQVLDLQVKSAAAQKSWRPMRKAAERWLVSCGPERIDGCRAKALSALSRIGAQKTPEAAHAKARVQSTRTADECLVKSESAARAKAPLPPCLDASVGHYKHFGDKVMVARAHLAKAQAAAGDPEKRDGAAGLYQRAAADCDEARCSSVKRRALKMAGWLELEGGDPQKAARLMLEEMQLSAEALPTDKRRYARTQEVDKVCVALDARDGPGSCRKLEKQVVGDYTFKDFSSQRSGGGLSADVVRTVNEHYNVSLQECLSAEAARLKPPAFETYQVRWMVLNDGRVDQVHMSNKNQDGSELALCLRRVFVVWRYPRYDGEAQHVEQSFTVSAYERR